MILLFQFYMYLLFFQFTNDVRSDRWRFSVHHGFGRLDQLPVLIVVSLVPFLLQEFISTRQDWLE